jgi:hypothetical protein
MKMFRGLSAVLCLCSPALAGAEHWDSSAMMTVSFQGLRDANSRTMPVDVAVSAQAGVVRRSVEKSLGGGAEADAYPCVLAEDAMFLQVGDSVRIESRVHGDTLLPKQWSKASSKTVAEFSFVNSGSKLYTAMLNVQWRCQAESDSGFGTETLIVGVVKDDGTLDPLLTPFKVPVGHGATAGSTTLEVRLEPTQTECVQMAVEASADVHAPAVPAGSSGSTR